MNKDLESSFITESIDSSKPPILTLGATYRATCFYTADSSYKTETFTVEKQTAREGFYKVIKAGTKTSSIFDAHRIKELKIATPSKAYVGGTRSSLDKAQERELL